MRSLVLTLLPLLAGCDIMFQLHELDSVASDAQGGDAALVRPAVVGSSVTSCSSCSTVLLPSPVVNNTRAHTLLLVSVVSTMTGGAPAVASVTYGTAALTFHARAFAQTTTGAVVETWIMIDPPPLGTGISVNLGGTAGELLVGASVIEGVSATTPIRAWKGVGSTVQGGSADNAVASGPLDLVVDTVCAGSSVGVPGAAQTVIYLKNATAVYPCANLGASWSNGAGTDAVVHWSVNGNATDHWIDLALSIAPPD